MPLWRTRPPRPTFCPVCDAPLTVELAGSNEPRCPACQAPLVPVEVGGFWRRVGAVAVDAAILAVTAGPLQWALAGVADDTPLFAGKTALESLLRVFELDPWAVLRRLSPLFVMSGVYLGLFWGLSGRTPGQKLLKLRVVDVHGQRPGPPRIIVRVLVTFLGLLPGALGWLWTAFDREKRALHDRIAGTYVVRGS
jgi:uncharacterized RDD family membrane protein YckC